MTARELKERYLAFFEKKGHKKLPNVSLVPENDPTALFINSGMHPLVPYLLGEKHPLGKKLVSNQRCLRTQDIEEVGNMMHLTFFEMLGNWSLGDYWKKEAVEWSWEFLTKELNLESKRLSVTCFAGDKDAPKDEETAKIWQKIGLPQERIYFLGKEDNWWAVGDSGPCGPDTEMFYDTGKKKCGPQCRPGDNCGKYFEVWNDVFMEFNRLANGRLKRLKQQNIDTGMGVERTITMLQGKNDVYQTELFWPIIQTIEEMTKKKYEGENQKPIRIIADHLKSAVFLSQDGVEPSNKERGYVMRRLIRRATVEMLRLGMIPLKNIPEISKKIIGIYKGEYFDQKSDYTISAEIGKEINAFLKVIDKGTKLLQTKPKIDGKLAFDLHQTYGFPLEITLELCEQWGRLIDKPKIEEEFKAELKKHQKKSRASLERKFAGGLADHSAIVTKYHTTTHLLHQALQEVLGEHVQQVGSNLTPERLRFDFTHPEKLTDKQIKKIETMINAKIKANLPVKMAIMSLEEAKKKGALAFFGEKYGEKVKVYSIGRYSKEVCGGPHVQSTGEIGRVKIIKEKAVGAGHRRLYIQLAHGS